MYKKTIALLLTTALTVSVMESSVYAQNKTTTNDISKISNIKLETINTERIEPQKEKNQKIEEAIIVALDLGFDEVKNTKYYYNYIDINSDGKNEVFVELYGSYFSGTGGNTALLFEEKNGRYRLIQKFTVVNNPIIISDEKTNGFNDIIMYVCGGGAESGYVALKFDGKNYPSNPSVVEKLPKDSIISGTEIISDEILYSFSNKIGE